MAAGFSWRSDEMLLFVDGLGLLVALSVLTTEPFRWNSRLVGIEAADLSDRGIKTGLKLAAGPLSLAVSLRRPRAGARGEPGRIAASGAVLRGAAFALPALGIFGALLASADQRFDALLSSDLPLQSRDARRPHLHVWPHCLADGGLC